MPNKSMKNCYKCFKSILNGEAKTKNGKPINIHKVCAYIEKVQYKKKISFEEAREIYFVGKNARNEKIEFLSKNPNYKYCSYGKHFAPKENFYTSKTSPICKDCRKKEYWANVEENKKKVREWRVNNPEKALQTGRNTFKKHKQRILAKQKEYYERNKEKIAIKTKEYYERNKEKIAVRVRKYVKNNKETVKEKFKKYYQVNKEQYFINATNRKNRIKNAKGSFTAQQWQEKLKYFGNRCYLCGESLENKTIHKEHRTPIIRGGSNWIANIAPACEKCNLSKNKKTEKEFRESKKASL